MRPRLRALLVCLSAVWTGRASATVSPHGAASTTNTAAGGNSSDPYYSYEDTFGAMAQRGTNSLGIHILHSHVPPLALCLWRRSALTDRFHVFAAASLSRAARDAHASAHEFASMHARADADG